MIHDFLSRSAETHAVRSQHAAVLLRLRPAVRAWPADGLLALPTVTHQGRPPYQSHPAGTIPTSTVSKAARTNWNETSDRSSTG